MANDNQQRGVVDADVHPKLHDKEIGKRLPSLWRRRWDTGNRSPGGTGYWNPGANGGLITADAFTDDGRPISSDPQLLDELFFRPRQIEYGILNWVNLVWVNLPEWDYPVAIARAANDHLIEDWAGRSDRIRCSVVVPANQPAEAAKEIRRVGSEPGVAQVLLPTGSIRPWGDRMFFPMYEAAEEVGLPVALHVAGNGSAATVGYPAGYPAGYLESHVALAFQYMHHLLSFVCNGVFQQFPGLKLVLVEGGSAWLPPLLWRFDKDWKGLRELNPWLDRPPSEIVAEHVYLTTQPIEEPARREHLQQIMRMFPYDRRLMFATDFPHWDQDTPDFTGRMFESDMARRVLYENAADLYNLPTPKRQCVEATS